jgi:hypothetical protein
MLGVDEHRIFGLAGLDPFARVFDAARVLSDRDDLEIFVFQLAVELLPPGQI